MKRTLHISSLALAVAIVAALVSVPADAQRRPNTAAAAQQSSATHADALAGVPLPASDAVMLVELRRLLSDAMPRALASDPARLAAVNADVESFKTKTGIDPRSFDTLAAAARVVTLPGGKVKIDHTVGVARGTFSTGAIVAAGKVSSKGNYREQKHAGKTVHVFTLNEQVKLFGLLGVRVSDLAVAELDAKTLAVGEPEAVRAAIDASQGRRAMKAADLALFAQPRDPGTLVAFGGKVPAEATRGLDLGNAEISQAVASIREFHGTVVTTDAGLDLQTALRTLGAADAKNLSDTLAALKQLAPLLLGRLSGDKGRLARSAVESLQVTQEGNEVRLRLNVPQGDIAALVRAF